MDVVHEILHIMMDKLKDAEKMYDIRMTYLCSVVFCFAEIIKPVSQRVIAEMTSFVRLEYD